jgi:hypothetical protein
VQSCLRPIQLSLGSHSFLGLNAATLGKSLESLAIPAAPVAPLRSVVPMVSGHARCLMGLWFAMVFTRIAHSAALVK